MTKLPISEFDFQFSRSSGAGGQNVNKLNTKVTLRWDIGNSKAFSNALKERFIKQNSRRINEEGMVVISSQRFRSQPRNIADCIEKLQGLLEKAAVLPKERKATRPTRASVEKRLKKKRGKSEVKKSRQKVKDY